MDRDTNAPNDNPVVDEIVLRDYLAEGGVLLQCKTSAPPQQTSRSMARLSAGRGATPRSCTKPNACTPTRQ